MAFFDNLLVIYLDAAPWLLLGFVAAGLIKVWVPDGALNRWLGGKGLWPITKAALIGAPLPLCSCGVIPAALGLHRGGASKGSTISFLIATPETGADSIVLSYALLGPFLAIVRPIAAVFSAIFSGLLTSLVPEARTLVGTGQSSCASKSCCDSESETTIETAVVKEESSDGGCTTSCCDSEKKPAPKHFARTTAGIRYAMVDIMDDIVLWIALGFVLAAVVMTLVPPMTLAQWGSGLPAMLLMLLVGIPMYICATASTPIAAALLVAGISPGTALVFLLAGPATNIATMGIVRREMGSMVLATYLVGICVSSILLGLLTDFTVAQLGVDVHAQISEGVEWLPEWLVYFSAAVLLVAATMSVARTLQQKLATGRVANPQVE